MYVCMYVCMYVDYYNIVKVQIGKLAGRVIVVLPKFDDSFLLKISAICYASLRSFCFKVFK